MTETYLFQHRDGIQETKGPHSLLSKLIPHTMHGSVGHAHWAGLILLSRGKKNKSLEMSILLLQLPTGIYLGT